MNSKLIRRTVGGSILALSLLFGIVIMSNSTAQAQYPWGRDNQERRDGDRNGDYRRDRNGDYRRNRDRNRNDRYRRSDRYGRNGDYANYGYNVYQIAENQGYQDGLNTGANDARQGQSYNPERSHYYKNATYGYNSSYGRKDDYKQAYRNGFGRGYDEGFQRYGGYNRGRNNNSRRFPFPW
jgi:hypothetical protein